MLEIKPINTSAVPSQFELANVNSAVSQQSAMTNSMSASMPGQCQHTIMDNLLTGFSNIILQVVGNIFQQVGLLSPNATNSINQSNQITSNENNNMINKPSIIDKGIDLVSTLFGGKLGTILNIFKGESGLFGKAKELFGKIF